MKCLMVFTFMMISLSAALAGQDFACMQDCYRQGYDRNYCVAMCSTGSGSGFLTDQPGLPGNPAFDQVKPKNLQQPPQPPVSDYTCMKNCQKRGYNYLSCQRVCVYAPPGY